MRKRPVVEVLEFVLAQAEGENAEVPISASVWYRPGVVAGLWNSFLFGLPDEENEGGGEIHLWIVAISLGGLSTISLVVVLLIQLVELSQGAQKAEGFVHLAVTALAFSQLLIISVMGSYQLAKITRILTRKLGQRRRR